MNTKAGEEPCSEKTSPMFVMLVSKGASCHLYTLGYTFGSYRWPSQGSLVIIKSCKHPASCWHREAPQKGAPYSEDKIGSIQEISSIIVIPKYVKSAWTHNFMKLSHFIWTSCQLTFIPTYPSPTGIFLSYWVLKRGLEDRIHFLQHFRGFRRRRSTPEAAGKMMAWRKRACGKGQTMNRAAVQIRWEGQFATILCPALSKWFLIKTLKRFWVFSAYQKHN